MASVSDHGGTRRTQSGGKIIRPRRISGARTPYDRPGSRNSGQQKPNWISRLVYYPTRVIASGARTLISSVLASDSSSSDSDAESNSDADENIEDDDISSPEDGTMEENEGLEMKKGLKNDQEPVAHMTDTKRVIEQLLMQETFVREESDKLMSIIKTRVIDHPTTAGTEDGRKIEVPIHGVGSDNDANYISSEAVLEARKWLEEKKSGSSSKTKLATEDDLGSPVDMAKSYMRTRPPWASASENNVEFRSPSPIGMRLFKDETPFSSNGSYLSSSKLKRGSSSAGTWNIQEEIRRVRAKATEDMLKNLSCSTTDWSSLSMERKHGINSLVTDIIEASEGDKSRYCAYEVDAPLNLDAGASSSCQVIQDVKDKGQNEALPNPAASTSELNPEMGAGQAIEGLGGLSTKFSSREGLEETLSSTRGLKSSEDTNTASQSGIDAADVRVDRKSGDTTQSCSTTGGTTHDIVILALGATRDSIGNCSMQKEVGASDNTASKEVVGETGRPCVSNGFPSSESCLSARVDTEPETRHPDEENKCASPAHNKQTESTHVEENCQLLSETLIEIPVVNEPEILPLNENDSVTTGSQKSSSIHLEWVKDDTTLPIPVNSTPSKLSRYNRRGRVRGRGRGRGK